MTGKKGRQAGRQAENDTLPVESYFVQINGLGNPCALELNDKGAKNTDGKKKDYGCCLKKEKHDRCLQCKSMDCSHDTCKAKLSFTSV